MRLKKLKLIGFKSFAKPTTLEFPHRISAIVGPNGSGKSNVAEAMAWVLGEQSIKTLRGKKGEDLIFNGSTSAPRMSKASVELVFSSDDGDESVVYRTVYRDGTNEYSLNDNHCRLKDIVEFLGNLGLGTSRHHIISQGEADRILTASLKDRREMIEDALGLRIYQIKKEESQRKLLKTEENIEKAESLKREIQPHLRFLKKQVGKAEEALALREKLAVLYAVYFFAVESKIKKWKEELSLKKKDPWTELVTLGKKILELKESLQKFREEKSEIDGVRAEVNALEREIGRYEGMLSGRKIKTQTLPKSEPMAFKKIRISHEKAEEFKNFVVGEIDRILKEEDVSRIKFTLTVLREKMASFFLEAEMAPQTEEPEVSDEKEDEALKEMEARHRELVEALQKLKEKEARLIKTNEKALDLERELYNSEIKASETKRRLNSFEIEEEKIQLLKNNLAEEKKEAKAILKTEITPVFDGDLDFFDIEKEKREIERVKIKLEESGSVGEEIVKEFNDVKERNDFLERELADLEKARTSLNGLIKQVEESLTTDFKTGVDKINKEFQNFFTIMFAAPATPASSGLRGGRGGGASAELRVVKMGKKRKEENNEDLLNEIVEEDGSSSEVLAEEEAEEGIEISVNLPRKRIKGLDMLSGGERALTSIALLFAMSQVNPPPFLILDETDAALDESNSRKYAEMLKDLSKKTQLILVTHNRETMKSAGVLYGVTMGQDGTSHLLSVKFAEAEELAGN